MLSGETIDTDTIARKILIDFDGLVAGVDLLLIEMIDYDVEKSPYP